MGQPSYQFYWSPLFDVAVADERRFPYSKYRKLLDRVRSSGVLGEAQLVQSPQADVSDVLRAHGSAYVDAILSGSIDDKAMRRIGFRWSDRIPTRSLTSVGGALAAAQTALGAGISGQLGGGTHHAHRDFGSGFCVFNDQAVVALTLLDEGRVRRVGILDLDVHQGDGTAAILSGNRATFVASVHGEKNFPFRKTVSDLDLPLPDGTEDDHFLAACRQALDAVIGFDPDIVLYQAGVDALADDRLGRLSVSAEGLFQRDRMVFDQLSRRGIPVSMAIGGGYAEPIMLSVEAYVGTYRAAKGVYGF